MSKLFQHYDSCFGIQCYLFLGSQDEMLKELTKAPVYFNKNSLEAFVNSIRSADAGLTVQLQSEDGISRYLICMPGFDWSVDSIVTLGHEATHVAQLALIERTITDFSNDSCFHCLIYLRDSVERVFLNKLNKWHEDEEKKKEKEEKEKMNDNIESVVSNEEESTADVELKKEIEKKEKTKKNKKK